MSESTRDGVDLAKRVIQVHAVDGAGQRVSSRALACDKFMAWRAQLRAGCMVAMEASSSAHHSARRRVALGLDARIIAAHLVAPYRMQGKSGVATAGDFKHFRDGAQFGAWLSLTPRQNSSGGKNNLGAITKRGDLYLRMLLIQGPSRR